ncbi:Nucleoside-diphosphate-sugar epimerase [Nonomuraea solani]|uniref:Nucleoside-diphosphate-sugar epimerase n=1 Tax=Nonomuraea solani TaxID=1144553 RepID=A0A1H6F0I5_9ACTN|nr:NAD-dependent epimerase/dehydratase family protein [Nonomuraea solani]SEH03650.1 Nucleoside-diphosphate-sugar epimerase [Nonomuraea solani]
MTVHDRSAFIIGGTGQIGRATAARLTAAGYTVTLGQRRLRPDAPASDGVVSVQVDRADTDALLKALDGHDLVVDTVAFAPHHGAQLARLAGRVGSLVVISTGAVYQAPGLPVPIPETWPTVERDTHDYPAGKAALERLLLATPGLPVSILRTGVLHGPYGKSLDHWSFIKRALDKRPHVVIAQGGRSRFPTTAVANIAELILLCARQPAARVLNIADDPLTVAEIGARVFAVMGHEAEIVTFEGPSRPDGLGFHPWNVPEPIVFSLDKARDELGYRPAVSYDDALRQVIEWAVPAVADGQGWQEVFPDLIARHGPDVWFPYAAEDAYVLPGDGHRV